MPTNETHERFAVQDADEIVFYDDPTENAFASDRNRKWYFAHLSADKATGGGSGHASPSDYSKVKVSVEGEAAAGVRIGDLWLKKFGVNIEKDDVCALVGAGEHGTVKIKVRRDGLDNNIELTYEGNTHWTTRRVVRAPGGKLVLKNDEQVIHKTGTGLGTQLLANQVEAASRLGIDHIEMYAARDDALNGYYTWPRLGYDGPLPKSQRAQFGTETVGELMKTEEGRAKWKEHGDGIDVSFDLAPGSNSRKVLDAYVAESAKRRKQLDN